jgi:hypothetical protein
MSCAQVLAHGTGLRMYLILVLFVGCRFPPHHPRHVQAAGVCVAAPHAVDAAGLEATGGQQHSSMVSHAGPLPSISLRVQVCALCACSPGMEMCTVPWCF